MRIERRAVKKLLLLGVGSALMFTMAGVGTAQADTNGSTATLQIHKSTAALAGTTQLVSVGGSRCAGCHRAHTAKAEYLLKQAQPALCYTCHGALGSVLDVVDGVNPNALSTGNTALRGGGFEFALIDGANASKVMPAVLDAYSHPASNSVPVLAKSQAVTSRHQIDGTTSGTMWGNGAISDTTTGALDAGKSGVTLECGSCHDPHGNGNYRILRPVPNDAATSAKAAVAAAAAIPAVLDDPATTTVNEAKPAVPAVLAAPAVAAVVVLPVAIPDVPLSVTRDYTTGNYWAVADRQVPTVAGGAAPIAGQTDGYITNVAAWCTTCHTRYLAGSGSYQTPLADAAGKVDATFTYRHRSDRNDKAGVSVPNCIQCHVSHGTNVAMSGSAASAANPAGLVPSAAGTPSAVGTSRLLRVDNRGTCEMCHNV